MKIIFISLLFLGFASASMPGQNKVRIGVAGLSHSHVMPLLRNLDRKDYLQIVGIAESDTDLSQRYAKEFGIDQDLFIESLDEMLEQTSPDGVITFTSIFDHLKVVEACAPRGIHVMVEKPLAVSPNTLRSHVKAFRKARDIVTDQL